MDNNVRISDCIAPAFNDLHIGLKNDQYDEVWLKGGRGSTKSSFASIEIILGMLRDPDANATAGRRYDNELRDSVFEQLLWAITALGVEDQFRSTVSPMRITRIVTNQMIIFKGADNPKKTKSIKLSRGYIKYVWLEEVDQYAGPGEIRTLLQSYFRGTDQQQIAIYSYNPPKSGRSWVNQEVKIIKRRRKVHHSDYLAVNPKWLGQRFISDAEHLQQTNDIAYRHEYLGEEVGTGLEVFNNVNIRTIMPREKESFDNIYQGLDFGYAADPFCFEQMHYSTGKGRLFIFDELSGHGVKNREIAEQMTDIQKAELTMADKAEPKSIDELRDDYGLNIMGADKPPGSIAYGIKWLQDLEEIIIDPESCPLAAKEFINYALEENRQGDVISKYPDKDNHSLDSTRYSMSLAIVQARIAKKRKDVKINNVPIESRW